MLSFCVRIFLTAARCLARITVLLGGWGGKGPTPWPFLALKALSKVLHTGAVLTVKEVWVRPKEAGSPRA